MKLPFFSLLVLGGVVLSACAMPQELEIVDREQRRLRIQNAKIIRDNAAIRNELGSVRSSLADTRANFQQMQRDLNALKEKVNETRYLSDRKIGQSTREGDQRIKELEDRMAKVDDDLNTQGTLLKAREEELRLLRETLLRGKPVREKTPALGKAGSTIEIVRKKTRGESETVRKDYEEARKLMEQKDYRASITRFKEFLKKYSKSDYADNAQYWIGEGYYALREFDRAILEFDAVRRRYPEGDKVPGSLLKLGYAFAELGDKVDARLILQELIDRYPQSQETTKAKQKLKALES